MKNKLSKKLESTIPIREATNRSFRWISGNATRIPSGFPDGFQKSSGSRTRPQSKQKFFCSLGQIIYLRKINYYSNKKSNKKKIAFQFIDNFRLDVYCIVNLFGLYVIIYKSPRSMKTYSRALAYAQVIFKHTTSKT